MGKDLKGKELGKGIYQRKDGYYCARFVARDGNRVEKYFKKFQECRSWLEDARYEDKHNVFYKEMLVNNLYEQWFKVKEKTVKPNSVKIYKTRYLINIKPVIGNMQIQKVLPTHCQYIFTNMAEENYNTTTIALTKAVLFNMFQYAMDNEIIEKNPCKKNLKTNIGKKSDDKNIFTLDNQKAFLMQAAKSSYFNHYCFVLQTGLRAGELIGLRWEDIDFKNKIITIKRTMYYDFSAKKWQTGTPKTQNGIRQIPLTNEAINILNNQKEHIKQLKIIPLEFVDSVFLDKKGKLVYNTTYTTSLKNICIKANIPKVSMHGLRHTFATRCIEGGMKPKILQQILGHSNIGITMNLYVHVTESEKEKEIREIEEYLKIGC